MKHTYYVITEPKNGGQGIDKITSDRELEFDEIVKFYEDMHDFDWERDSITLVDIDDIGEYTIN